MSATALERGAHAAIRYAIESLRHVRDLDEPFRAADLDLDWLADHGGRDRWLMHMRHRGVVVLDGREWCNEDGRFRYQYRLADGVREYIDQVIATQPTMPCCDAHAHINHRADGVLVCDYCGAEDLDRAAVRAAMEGSG